MKNNGPNKEPCGTPEVTVNQSEASPSTITFFQLTFLYLTIMNYRLAKKIG